MFKFRKVASALASGAMLTSTVALAAAANYPAPFVDGGSADVALVYGSASMNTDLVAVVDITSNLNSYVTSNSVTTPNTIEGDVYELFTSGTPLLLNSTLNAVRSTVSATHLPTVLADGTFQTTTNIEYTQRLDLGLVPRLEFKQQPSSSDDPQLGFSLSTTPSTGYVYNATVVFNEAVNFTHADSKGETIELFGQQYTVSGATTSTKLVLLKSSQEITLTNEDPSAEVTVEGDTYTVELISASDTDANIRVIDSSGNSNSKVISESNSKSIQGLEVAVDAADENNFQISATLLVGSSRITFQDGSPVKVGTDETTIEGTQVEFELANGSGTTAHTAIGRLMIQSTVDSSDKDAFFPGGLFVDPVFGTVKLDFSSVTIPVDSTDRENIEIKNSGNDQMTIKFMSHDGSEDKTFNWVYNRTGAQASIPDLADSDGERIIVSEMTLANKSEYVVLSSDDEGGLYELSTIYNASTGFADDYVRLKNVFTGNEKDYKATSEGTITGITEQGKTFTITYQGPSTATQEARQIRVNYDESTGNNMMLYPTIATSKGAKVGFYEPITVTLTAWDGTNAATGLVFQDGDGYTTHTINGIGAGFGGVSFNVTCSGGSAIEIASSLGGAYNRSSVTCTTGKLTYNITASAANTTQVFLQNPQTGANIAQPALIVFEEKDDASNYEAMVVVLSGLGTDADGLGVSDVVRTWGGDTVNDEVQLESDSDLYQEMDIWGSLITSDKSDSDQVTATISYPDEQVIANVYVAEIGASITTGGTTAGGGTSNIVAISDNEVSSVAGKNLIVVGGSCVNSVAADLLGSGTPMCGSDFTATTGVGAGQYLIETFSRSGEAVATLVAGYNAGDTTNAASALTTQSVSTDVGAKYIGTTASSLEIVTTTEGTDEGGNATA